MRRVTTLAALAVWIAACGENDVSRMIGARCDDSDECDERCLTPDDDYPGGLCTLSCDDDGDCPDGSACVEDDGGVCLFTCRSEAGCSFLGAGWSCAEREGRPEGTVMVCRGE
jgi:hypothetical protein